MKETKTQKGITLIALIITIIVLLILAVVAINAIQNDGIIEYAKNASTEYEKAQKTEKNLLQEYEDEITAAKKGFEAYHIRDLVTLLDKDGNEHEFYVIKESDESQSKVTLMAKQCIIANKDAQNYLTQSDSGYEVAFSTVVYWGTGNIKEETYPIPESHIAAKAAYDYGEKFDVKTGRLLTYSEVEELNNDNNNYDMIGGEENAAYWLGTARYGTTVWFMDGLVGNVLESTTYDQDDLVGVRPVIEISKSLLPDQN